MNWTFSSVKILNVDITQSIIMYQMLHFHKSHLDISKRLKTLEGLKVCIAICT